MRRQGLAGFVATALGVAAFALGCDAGPKQLTPDEIVAAFASQNAAQDRAFHMELQGSVRTLAGPQMGPVNTAAAFDISGEDFVGTMTSGTNDLGGGMGGLQSTTSYARVGGISFRRYEDAAWERTDEGVDRVTAPDFDPMRGLIATDVAYERAETVDDRSLHVIRVLNPASAIARTFDNGTGATFEADQAGSEFLLYLDPQGIPVGARAHLSGVISAGGFEDFKPPPIRSQLSFTYQFSGWGTEIAITPPI